MADSRADGGYNTLADTGQDSLFAGTTDKLLDVGTHRDTGFGNELNTVFCHSSHRRSVDNFGIDRGLDSLQYVATSKIDGCGGLEIEVHIGLIGADEGVDDGTHVAASKVVSLKVVLLDFQTGFRGTDEVANDDRRRHLAKTHKDELHK